MYMDILIGCIMYHILTPTETYFTCKQNLRNKNEFFHIFFHLEH